MSHTADAARAPAAAAQAPAAHVAAKGADAVRQRRVPLVEAGPR